MDDDAVHVDRQEVLVIESPPHQLGERRLTGLDELARDAAPGDADGAGRLGQDLGIFARRHAHDHDLMHALGEPRILVQLLVGGDRHFAPPRCRRSEAAHKSFLFADAGAHASANLYSLVQTCKAGGVDRYRYVTRLFQRLPLA
ncbi:hypothetical protein GGD68_003342 [Paraburkholderia fungorum]|uniref:Uncharacterized protein n=1 Tax=Paraburkholderia fungorum TaxID=134537 RepID=A0AAW3UW92_9BURK|nr:hypothetical protein [Paraburkholderia fungorum]MBB6202511.1 hypothetical protein [Paraburkholderia fungorum]